MRQVALLTMMHHSPPPTHPPTPSNADALVIHMYQLLRSLNPAIELVTEMMLPRDMAYLAPSTPVRGVDHAIQYLLAPAYMSGAGVLSACVCLRWRSSPLPPLAALCADPPKL